MASGTDQTGHPVVGRQVEMAAIESAINECADGRGRVAMFVGEPGIGKSTLARFAASTAEAAGIPVYWGFAWEAGGAPAYWPWTQLFSSLVDDLQPPAALIDKLHLLLPGQRNPDTESESGLQPGQARFQLLESVRQLLDAVSDDTPLVLILEDLHAADTDSLTLLQYICRHAQSMPILLIGTFRDIEARTMQGGDVLWQACRDADVVRLDRLARNDVDDYLKAESRQSVRPVDVEALYAATEGNPLFLTELVGLLEREGRSGSRLPENVQQVIRQQASLLPKDALSLLGKAAVIGREFDARSLAAISDQRVGDVRAELDRIADTGLLRTVDDDRYRFTHGLHRDVLYGDLGTDDRALLHRRMSAYLRKLIDEGREDHWSRLAENLSLCGPEGRLEAVDAWREAARRAQARLAFDEAAVSFGKALCNFGEGPAREPADRYELLLEYAEARFLTGDSSGGHAQCREAFNIARTLEDATRMARAALTWGSAIVVAQVNSELIDALRECLDALPESEAAWRARVLARLAAALQPAPDPSAPMDMAREALTLARSTNDGETLYHVLRFAIGALMDFAPADERRALNEEFAELARQRGDLPGRFRSTLRLIIDCCELSDRAAMDRYVDECRRIADRIGLPHYQWRACSVRAMQATIDGAFSRATRLLDLAEVYAGEIDDLEAKVTIPLQRFAILIEWDSDEGWSLARIEECLQSAYAAGMSAAEFFVTPFVDSYKQPLTRASARLALGNQAIVDRTFAGGDRYSVCRLGETAAIAEDIDTAERAYQRLLPFEDYCATLGLMGSSCSGPISWTLAKLAMSLGQADDAERFIDKAITIAGSMGSPGWLARTHWTAAGFCRSRGDHDEARQHDAAAMEIAGRIGLRREASVAASSTVHSIADSDHPIALQQHGDMWHIDFRGAGATLRDSKGLRMLETLVSRPETDIHVLDLAGGSAVADEGAPGPALDDKARREYEARLRALAEEIEEADALGDIGRADAARSEQDLLTRQLSGAYGLGGRRRNTGTAAERARVNVRRRLKDAIDRIGQQLPEAGKFLENTIKTGTYCRYTPV